jgi:hypothetical protein
MSTEDKGDKNIRKYNSKKRKKLSQKINKLQDKGDYIKILKIVIRDLGESFSENKNGIWFNMNLLSDDALDEIIELLNTNLDTTNESENKFTYVPYDNNLSKQVSGPRLSNHERSLIRKIRIADSEEI